MKSAPHMADAKPAAAPPKETVPQVAKGD